MFSAISNSSVNGVINLPASVVGGIVGDTRTTAAVKACSFVGTINGGSGVGGIVGTASNAADSFIDCHVDAALTAKILSVVLPDLRHAPLSCVAMWKVL